MKSIKIAVISDLHCHPKKNDDKDNCTRLFTDLLRDEVNCHPVESFSLYYKNNKPFDCNEFDYLFCPGDVTNHSDVQGFLTGWDYVREVSQILNAKEIYATLGNHDIDSRHNGSPYYLKIPKGIKKGFPINEIEIGTFWEKGYTFIEKKDIQLLIINTTHFHTHVDKDSNPTVKGEITTGPIQEIENYLKENSNDEKIKIMMCHHHPIQHSDMKMGAYDFIENGEELIAVLAKYKFDLVIHGHKHYPKLKKYNTDNGTITILSSGSFSASTQTSFINKFNYIHILEIEKNNGKCKGIVKSPNYKYQVGWENSSDGFDFYSGFGAEKSNSAIVDEITNYTETKDPMPDWNKLCDNIEDLKFLLPIDLKEILSELEKNQIVAVRDNSNYPKQLYNNKKLRERNNDCN